LCGVWSRGYAVPAATEGRSAVVQGTLRVIRKLGFCNAGPESKGSWLVPASKGNHLRAKCGWRTAGDLRMVDAIK